jgi:2-oxoglutarate ferredoxin oxidoreductase subunit alpha
MPQAHSQPAGPAAEAARPAPAGGRALFSGGQMLAEAALAAGCRHAFCAGGPLRDEVARHLARRLPAAGGVLRRAGGEARAAALALGAAQAGGRVLVSAAGAGVNRLQEGLGYLAAQELPAVAALTTTAGPGAGNPAPAQSDYWAVTRGGHGDHRCLVLAPASCQEAGELGLAAFDLARRFRAPVVLVLDGLVARLVEPARPPRPGRAEPDPAPDWALAGARGRPARCLRSLLAEPKALEAHNHKLTRKHDAMRREETRWEEHLCGDAELVVVAYGSAARVALAAVAKVRELGFKAGLVRPVSLWPFPRAPLAALSRRVKLFLAFELCSGQMVEDVEAAVAGRAAVHLYGRPGGAVATPREVAHQISRLLYAAGRRPAPPPEGGRG